MQMPRLIRNIPWLRVWLTIFFGYLTLGASFQTIPLVYQQNIIKLSTIMLTSVIAVASFSAAIIRPFAGKRADFGHAKSTMLAGSIFAILGTYLQSQINQFNMVIIGRIMLGCGEGALFTAGVTWLINSCDTNLKGTFAGWLGLAMWLGLGLGPLLVTVLQQFQVSIINIHSKILIILPIISLTCMLLTPKLVVIHPKVIRQGSSGYPWKALWRPGSAFLLASYGYGSIQSILLLYTESYQPSLTEISLVLFAGIFILTRTIGSPLVAIYGGDYILSLILPIEAMGLILIPIPHISLSIIGICLTACGVALLYPAFVSLIAKNLPAAKHGQAIGILTSFWDFGILLSGPLGGLLIHYMGFKTAFYAAGGFCLIALWIIKFSHNMEENHYVPSNK
jgi:MFS family permease